MTTIALLVPTLLWLSQLNLLAPTVDGHHLRMGQGTAQELNLADPSILDERLRKIAGADAIDCGHVKVNEDPKPATSCVQKSFRRRKSFFVRYEITGIDSGLAGGLASDPNRNVFAVTFDSMGMRTDDLRSGESMPDGSHTLIISCPSPVKIRVNERRRATCFKKQSKPVWIGDE